MPSLNEVTSKCCIGHNCNYYITITFLQNKVKIVRQIFKVVIVFSHEKYSCTTFRVAMCHAWHKWHVLSTTGLAN
jgi:hypothetical protein